MSTDEIIIQALAEDIGGGDHTSIATIPPDAQGQARLYIKETGVLCGVDIAVRVFHHVDPLLEPTIFISDGTPVNQGDIAFSVSGKIRSILQSERLALNFMQRLSGIATATNRVVKKLEGFHARLLDTRKTTPLLRELEKYAVRTGGGLNHRMGLFDMVMIKDNHVDYSGGIAKAIDRAREYLNLSGKNLKIEIEVRNFDELQQVLNHGYIDRIMLDNFVPAALKEAVGIIDGRYETEASGGITEDNVQDFAATGVDFISMGALTHQIRSLDMSLKAE